MADPLAHPETPDGPIARPHGTATSGRPRWFYVVAITIAVLLLVVMIVLHVTGVVGPGAH